MRRNRRVKIVATLGPASNNEETMRRLFEAGADVFRVNMSHATHDGLRDIHAIVRKLEVEFARPIGILVDLQGPKLRIGKFESGSMRLTEGEIVSFVRRESVGGLGRVLLPHPEIFQAVEAGHTMLIDDGKLRLRVVEASDVRIDAEVQTSGLLGSRKGISLPDTVLPFGAMTDKDRADVEVAMSLGVAWIALSFVQRGEDVAEARKLVRGRAAVMAKIEKPSALNHLDEIIDLSDAHHGGARRSRRRDAGGESPGLAEADHPRRPQRRQAGGGRHPDAGIDDQHPRAHPGRGLRRRHRGVRRRRRGDAVGRVRGRANTRSRPWPPWTASPWRSSATRSTTRIIHAQRIGPEATGADAISAAARTVAETLNLAAIICYTASGATSLRAARERPQAADHRLDPDPATGRKLALVWGLHCVLTDDPRDLDDMVAKACRIAYQEGFALPGQRVIISAGVPLGTPGATNMLRMAFVGDETEDF